MASTLRTLTLLLAATLLSVGCNATVAQPPATAAPATATPTTPAPSSAPPAAPLPESLRPGSDELLVLKASAAGTQNYECRASGGGFAWALVGPDAVLTDDAGKTIGRHYAGPTWESTDGSKVVAEVKARADAPGGRSVPWLLLKAKTTSGTGVFSRVTSIQRTDTVGGVAPETGCDAQHAGARQASPYRAAYTFYATRP